MEFINEQNKCALLLISTHLATLPFVSQRIGCHFIASKQVEDTSTHYSLYIFTLLYDCHLKY